MSSSRHLVSVFDDDSDSSVSLSDIDDEEKSVANKDSGLKGPVHPVPILCDEPPRVPAQKEIESAGRLNKSRSSTSALHTFDDRDDEEDDEEDDDYVDDSAGAKSGANDNASDSDDNDEDGLDENNDDSDADVNTGIAKDDFFARRGKSGVDKDIAEKENRFAEKRATKIKRAVVKKVNTSLSESEESDTSDQELRNLRKRQRPHKTHQNKADKRLRHSDEDSNSDDDAPPPPSYFARKNSPKYANYSRKSVSSEERDISPKLKGRPTLKAVIAGPVSRTDALDDSEDEFNTDAPRGESTAATVAHRREKFEKRRRHNSEFPTPLEVIGNSLVASAEEIAEELENKGRPEFGLLLEFFAHEAVHEFELYNRMSERFFKESCKHLDLQREIKRYQDGLVHLQTQNMRAKKVLNAKLMEIDRLNNSFRLQEKTDEYLESLYNA